MTKTDIAESDSVRRLISRLRGINPSARVIEAAFGEAGPVVLNGVQHIIHPPQHLDEWPDEDHRLRIIFIMKRIRPRELLNSLRAFRGLLGAQPLPLQAEPSVSSP